MTSKSVTGQVQVPDRDEPLEAAKIPLKHKGLDVASQMRSVKQAKPDLASSVGNYSVSIEQTLSVIEAIEATLQHKRRQIEEIQTRQEALALEYRKLGRSLESETKDMAQKFAGFISDLETDILPLSDDGRTVNALLCATHRDWFRDQEFDSYVIPSAVIIDRGEPNP
jgi:primosomal replication protein N